MSKFFIGIFLVCFVSVIPGQTPQAVNRANESGLARYAKGDYRGAVADFTKAIDLATSLPGKGVMRNQLVEGGDELVSESPLENVRIINPKASGLYVNRGNAFFLLGEPERAIDDFDRAIRMSPSLVMAYISRGSALLFLKDPDRALADYERAIKLDPLYIRGYVGRGMAQLDKGDVRLAFADFDRAVELSPNKAFPYYYRGDARRVTGDVPGALTDFEIAIKLDPRFPDPYLGRGTIRLNKRDCNGAIADFTTVLNLDGRLAQAYKNRGYAYFASGRIVEAQMDFDRAVTLVPLVRQEIDANLEKMKNWKFEPGRGAFCSEQAR